MRWLRVLPWVVGGALALWVLLIAAVYLFGQRDEARAADAIVVLGAAQYDGRPSPVLQARLDHAIRLYDRGLAPVLILTGGTGVGDTVSEAVVGGRYAVRAGVPNDKILTERVGTGSIESMKGVAGLMAHHGLESAVLVSDPFHMLRLRLLALREGITAYSSPTRTSPISQKPDEEWHFIVRESLALPLTLLLGRV